MITTLRVQLLSGANAAEKWEGWIEIDGSSMLEELHFAIQNAVGFDNDHLYEFFIARTDRSRERTSFDDDNGGLYDTAVGSLFPLPERRSLFYLFDYGDYWILKISRARKDRDADPKATYPRLIREIGTKPQQYPGEEDWDA